MKNNSNYIIALKINVTFMSPTIENLIKSYFVQQYIMFIKE